jgi:hypothetical protein
MGDATMICLDIGSLYTRIGPCGEDAPVDVFATEVDSATGEVGYSDTRKNAIKAVQKGHVVDTNAIEKVWEYSVNSMRPHCDQNVNPGVIINFRPNMTDKEKSHLAEFMFEGLEYVHFPFTKQVAYLAWVLVKKVHYHSMHLVVVVDSWSTVEKAARTLVLSSKVDTLQNLKWPTFHLVRTSQKLFKNHSDNSIGELTRTKQD